MFSLRPLPRATHTLWTATRHSSKISGADFLKSLSADYKDNPKKRQTSSDILRSLTANSTKSSAVSKRGSLDLQGLVRKAQSGRQSQQQHPQSSTAHSQPQSHQKPKPKHQDVYTDFDPLTSKYKESVSARENEFYTEKLKQVFAINSRFDIMAIGGANGTEKMKLKTFIARLKDDELFDVVDVQQVDDVQYPLVRAMNKEATFKTFGDKKAAELTKLFGRTKEKKRSSNIKFIKVSWEISQTDLENQKTNEIISQLKKGYKLTIAIDTRENLQKTKYAFDEDTSNHTENLNNLEKLRREKAFEYVKTLLEASGTVDYTGSTKGKIIINVTPKPSSTDKKPGKQSAKEQKNNDRAAKQKKREEEKRAQAKERAKHLEETMANFS